MEIKKFSVGYMPTNCYVLSSDGVAVIVDPGGGYGSVRAYLEQRGLKAVAVLLTHGHFDHIADVFKWVKDGADVYIHENDASCLYDGRDSLAAMVGLTYPPVRTYSTFSDGQSLRFGDVEIKVIHTPGHTKGGCCFVVNDEFILTGDTVLCESYGRTDFPGGSEKELVESINGKLFTLDKDYLIYPGHGDDTTLKHEKLCNPIRRV